MCIVMAKSLLANGTFTGKIANDAAATIAVILSGSAVMVCWCARRRAVVMLEHAPKD